MEGIKELSISQGDMVTVYVPHARYVAFVLPPRRRRAEHTVQDRNLSVEGEGFFGLDGV